MHLKTDRKLPFS